MNRKEREMAVLEKLKDCDAVWDTVLFSDIKETLGNISNTELEDMEGFIYYCVDKKMSDDYIASNIVHDINGFRSEDEFFSPRTENYKQFKE